MHDYLRPQTWIDNWNKPYKRYQFQNNIHALRLAVAVVCASLVGYVFQLRHSEWIPITVFVVLGTIPYQGSIADKAFERIIGTVIGMTAGLALLWLNQNHLHHNILFFILVFVISAICGWKSLGKRGYAAMLAGLTMCMLLGHGGSNWIEEGAIRAFNVIIGACIAIGLSQLIPIKSTLMWRFTTADNLAACAHQLAAVTAHQTVSQDAWQHLLEEQRAINARLVKARSLLAAAVVETGISGDTMEQIQQSQRSIVSSINLILASVPRLPKPRLNIAQEQLLSRHFFSLQHDLRLASLLLKGDWRQHIDISFDEEEPLRELAVKLPFEWQGLIWVSLNIRAELFSMLTRLQQHRSRWLTRSEWARLQAVHETDS